MTGLDLFIIAIGLLLVVASFIFGEKISEHSNNKVTLANNDLIDEEVLQSLQKVMETKMSRLSEVVVADTEKKLNKVTNEKIMAVSDYANELLAKIDQNHTEVVFLYNMLNEKEEVLKKEAVKMTIVESNKQDNGVSESKVVSQSHLGIPKKIEGINEEEAAMLNTIVMPPSDAAVNIEEDTETRTGNRNKEIMDLYAKGKTITQIAKTLNLGKGEVKLVVNLHQ